MMRALFGLMLAAGLASGAFAQDAGHAGMDHSGMNHGEPAAGSASSGYMAAMETMNRSMSGMAMTGRPGVDFAEMMIPHHQSAIDMAKAYLASGEGDPVLTKISEDVVSSQEKEIAELRAWLDKNRDR